MANAWDDLRDDVWEGGSGHTAHDVVMVAESEIDDLRAQLERVTAERDRLLRNDVEDWPLWKKLACERAMSNPDFERVRRNHAEAQKRKPPRPVDWRARAEKAEAQLERVTAERDEARNRLAAVEVECERQQLKGCIHERSAARRIAAIARGETS